MKYDNVPDRRIGLLAGLIGGAVGMTALRLYIRGVEPELMPTFRQIERRPLGDVIEHHELDDISLIGTHHQLGESSSTAAGRLVYHQVMGAEPDATTKAELTLGMQYLWGLLAGAAYGSTRTTTAPRDLASGFFYGTRLWIGDAFISALLGVRPGPTAQPVSEHIRRLARIWIFSFAATQATRLIYLALDPQAWKDL